MTSILDKLNLSPQERRLVVVIAIVVFVVLNIWLIWPEFGSVTIWKQRRADTEKRLKQFKDEIAKKAVYERQLRELESQGQHVGTEEQALSLQRDVSNQALLSGVQVNRYDPQPRISVGGRTNAFFEEQGLIITVITGEKELVDFLYNLGTRSSLIRVRSMTLSRDPTQMKLQGSMTLVASFAKKAPPRTATPAPKATNQPPTRPAAPKTNAPPRTNTPPPRLDSTRRT